MRRLAASAGKMRTSARRLGGAEAFPDEDGSADLASVGGRSRFGRRSTPIVLGAVLVGLIGVGLWHSGQSSTSQETTLHAIAPHSRAKTSHATALAQEQGSGVLAPEYQVLIKRSLFAADGTASGQAAAATSPTADSAFALKGVSQEDTRYTAYVEDAAAKRVIPVRVGDLLARGRVRDITLHAVEYEVAGRVTHVDIGQTLDGSGTANIAAAPASVSPPPVASASDSPIGQTHHHHSATMGEDARASTSYAR